VLIRPRVPAFWLLLVMTLIGGLAYALELGSYLSGDAAGALLAIALWGLWVVPIILLVYALDLFEREPPPLCIAAFAWGALVAGTFVVSANVAGLELVAKLASPDFADRWGAAIVAPPNEELLKLLGLIVLVLLARHHFDGLLDGFIYGGLVGLGFQVVENLAYSTGAAHDAGGSGAIGLVLVTFLMRGIVGGLWTHALFTGLSGLGVAYYLTARTSRLRRTFVAIAAICGGMALHFIWNSPWLRESAGENVIAMVVGYLVKGIAGFLFVGCLVRAAIRKEARDYIAALEPDVQAGLVSSAEVQVLGNLGQRFAVQSLARQLGGTAARRAVRTLQHATADLAVARARGLLPSTVEARRARVAREHERVVELCGREFLESAAAPAAERQLSITALAFSGLGIVFALPEVVGVLLAVLARSRARKARRPLHWSASAGLTLGVTLLLVHGSLLTLAVAVDAPDTGQSRALAATRKGALVSGALRDAVAKLKRGVSLTAAAGIDVDAGRVHVEVVHRLTTNRIRDAIEAQGGEPVALLVPGLAEALVPFDKLETLEATPGVSYVRPPVRANEPDQSTAQTDDSTSATNPVDAINAGPWHESGIRGATVKIGIIDGFDRVSWDAAVTAGKLAVPAGTRCFKGASQCDIWAGDTKHGAAVGETVHTIAPDAQLYLASAVTANDLQAAVDWFATNGVTIISRSSTAKYDGAGDGTGPIARVIDNAVSRGIMWFNSAGNSGGASTRGPNVTRGGYWRGTWRDADNDGWLDFAPGDESLGFTCHFVSGVRWNDWDANKTDYDVFVYDTVDSTEPFYTSDDDQSKPDAKPIELPNCKEEGEVDFLQIKLYGKGDGTAGDVLEFMTKGAVEYWTNPYSASAPAADTASSGAIAVGAIEGDEIAVYSAHGPTNDGRVKPDLSAVSCVTSIAYDPCFNGTSAATPVAAAATALVLDGYRTGSPTGLKEWLTTYAVVDSGDTGLDNRYGAGALRLPAPPEQGALATAAPV
jgi:RsiW-degrading membrane proteinase PrsW (M82 family)